MSEPSRRGINIKEVARAAGVSVTTVSHVLNDKGRLNAETRERVCRIAAELGYRPNSAARNLVGKRTGLLGLALSPGSSATLGLGDLEYFAQLMLGATTAALKHGYALVLTPSDQELGS